MFKHSATLVRPFDVLRLVLDDLTRRQLPPTPGFYAASYRRIISTPGTNHNQSTISELHLCASLLDALKGLVLSQSWTESHIKRLRHVLENTQTPLEQQITEVETVIDALMQHQQQVQAESQQFSTELYHSTQQIHQEISTTLEQLSDKNGLIKNLGDELSATQNGRYLHTLAHQLQTEVCAITEQLANNKAALNNASETLQNIMRRIEQNEYNHQQRNNLEEAIDPITGALTEKGLTLVLEKPREGQHALLMVDIDHFRALTTEYEPAVCQQILQAVTRCLHSGLRDSDYLAHFDDGRFVILLSSVELPKAHEIGQRLLQSVAAWYRTEQARAHGLHISISAGVSAYTINPETPTKHHAIIQKAWETAQSRLKKAQTHGDSSIVAH